MKKALLGMVLLAGSALAAPGVSFGIGIGAPVVVARPVCPGPGYVWMNGYYGPSRVWVPGYWRRPVVVAPPRRVIYDRRYYAPRNEFRHDYRRNEFRRDYRR